jgi:group I intron endonuclease
MHTIYLTTNKINGKKYVGQRLDRCDNDKYLGSGKLMLKAIRKYGRENFYRINIDFALNQDEADEKEKFWQLFYGCFNPSGYNIAVGAFGGDTISHHPHRDAIARKHSSDLKGRKQSAEHIAAARTARISLNRKNSEETKRKISEKLKEIYKNKDNCPWFGKHLSEEHKKRISLAKQRNNSSQITL